MIEKVIIAEDQESANLSIQKNMEQMQVKHFDYVFYCDDAFNRIDIAKRREQPYDLLITDLFFEADDVQQKLKSGMDLIAAVRRHHPELRILVFSAEHHPEKIRELFDKYEIDGYVRKARHDAQELKLALEALSRGDQYCSRVLSHLIKQPRKLVLSEYEIQIIRLLANGHSQKQIRSFFEENKISPASLSSIEKHLRRIREELNFTKNEQLVLFCKENGIL